MSDCGCTHEARGSAKRVRRRMSSPGGLHDFQLLCDEGIAEQTGEATFRLTP